MPPLVYSSPKGNAITDSLKVAAKFGKRPANVLATYRTLKISPEFNELNFKLVDYTDRKGERRPKVVMTRAGFVRLVFGFTGKKAAAFIEDYITEFDAMEAQLRTPPPVASQPVPTPLTDFTKPAVQVQRVKATTSWLFRLHHNSYAVINHHRGVMKCLTARTPSQYVRDAVANGLRVRSLSGRQLLRRLEPGKAATAAFMDEQVERGHTLEQLAAAGIPQTLPAAFDAMLRAGITPAELPPL